MEKNKTISCGITGTSYNYTYNEYEKCEYRLPCGYCTLKKKDCEYKNGLGLYPWPSIINPYDGVRYEVETGDITANPYEITYTSAKEIK